MVFGQEPLDTSLTCVTTGVGPQLSLTLPPAKFGGGTSASHCTVTFGGQVMDGASVSLTVTVKLQLAVLPAASVAAHITVVVPLANAEPDGGEQVTVALPESSLAVTV
jgi:hypothetical protein